MSPRRKQKNTSQEIFTLDSVHVHFDCDCRHLPKMNIKVVNSVSQVHIPVPHTCPTCKVGQTQEVIIGNMQCETNGRCQHPGCTCEEVYIILPLNQFMSYVN